MLNQIKSVAYGFSLLPWLFCLVLVGKWPFVSVFFGHLFFGAKNSGSCLSQFLGNREVRPVGLISNLILGF